jgi:uncharacterized membrane protein
MREKPPRLHSVARGYHGAVTAPEPGSLPEPEANNRIAEPLPSEVGRGTARPVASEPVADIRTGVSLDRDVGGRMRLMGHALHPVLVTAPIGLLVGSVMFDVITLVTDRETFRHAAGLTLGLGVVGAVAASIPGWVDWTSIPKGTRARRIGLSHGLLHSAVVAAFAVSFLLRFAEGGWEAPAIAVVISLGAFLALAIGSWLGAELVERHGVGVRSDAALDAPSSLHRRPVVVGSEVGLADRSST